MLKYLSNLVHGVKKSEDDSKYSLENRSVKDILKKFKKGNYIESRYELKVLQRYASTGMVHFGFNCKEGKSDAKLTDMGRWFVKQL